MSKLAFSQPERSISVKRSEAEEDRAYPEDTGFHPFTPPLLRDHLLDQTLYLWYYPVIPLS